jgi:hypothetical protein
MANVLYISADSKSSHFVPLFSPYQKCSSTKVGIEILDSQWGESAHALKGPRFLFGRGREGGRWDFVIPNVSPCQVPNWFSTCSPCSQCLNPQHVLSCTSLCPICFAKTLYSWKFGTYIGRQILRLISFVNIFYINKCPTFQNFFMMGQSKKFIETKSMNLDGPPTRCPPPPH